VRHMDRNDGRGEDGAGRNVYTVSELNLEARALLEESA